ncbi:MAG TPA: DUF998 domain-containing protein [Candidatus Saccharimonadales bacterium]|nr:DUF998 domain-containing protein [Candidatus Saccharimonadales bacterium]
MKRVETFTDRFPLIGPLVWILSVQYFLVQILVGTKFMPTYSLRFNTISDLGNTACGVYSGRSVCSPWHNLMNFSLICLGITMALGALFIYQEFKEKFASFIGFSFMAMAGFGTLMVGLFPENSISWLHVLGASLPFLLGNIALIILGLALAIPKLLRNYTLISGLIALIFLILFYTENYFGLGIGGIERFVAYPQTIWLIVFGIYMSKNHFTK